MDDARPQGWVRPQEVLNNFIRRFDLSSTDLVQCLTMSQSPTNSQRIAFLLLGASLALGFIIGSEKLSTAIAQVRNSRPSIMVKGVATQNVKSDQAIINYIIVWRGTDPVTGRKAFVAQRDIFQKKLFDYGFKESEINIEAIEQTRLEPANAKTTAAIEYDKYARGTVPDFIYFQRIKITTSNVDLVDKLSREDFVFENDVELDRRQLAYKLINVDDSKKELLLIASKNARARADVLVSGSGSKIGTLLDASQGAFSIQAKDSVGDSDYRSIDISSIEKTIRVVVTMTYEIVKE